MQENAYWFTGLSAFLLAGCATVSRPPSATRALAPDLLTGTAIVAAKSAGATQHAVQAMTPEATEPPPIVTMPPWTPSPSDGITAGDSGKTFDIWITSRITVILDSRKYPMQDLREECVPFSVLGRVSNIPAVPWPYYPIRYEAVQLGKCIIRNGQFEVTIAVVPQGQ